jgi:hypothetical protein
MTYKLPERLRRLAGQAPNVRPGLEENGADDEMVCDDFILELAGVKSARPALEAKQTYPKARAELLDYLESKGWKVSRNLKVQQATSPNGKLKFWFKAQAVWYTYGNSHKAGNARTVSYDLDIRRLTPEQFVKQYGAEDDASRWIGDSHWVGK